MPLLDSIQNIAIIADPLSAGVISAIMAARLPGKNYTFDVYTQNDPSFEPYVYARPNIRHIHQLLQITEGELIKSGAGKMVMALPVEAQSKRSFMLPLGHYGIAKNGCDFQHFWHCAFEKGLVKDLEHYNFALRLDQVEGALDRSPEGCPKVDPGYKFDREKYGQYLLKLALNSGQIHQRGGDVQVKFSNDGNCFLRADGQKDIHYDLILNVSHKRADEPSGWTKNYINIVPDCYLSGMFLYQLQSAVTRLFELWPRKADMNLEAREYNRRLKAEREHISDMVYLCKNGASENMGVRLERKVELFRAKGRIAFEDNDAFSVAEWITVLRASGVKAIGHHRLADRLPIGNIVDWLQGLDKVMSRHVKHVTTGQL
ncbi:MAG: tryptophan 7-halogenase [Maricaulaceae bacterium]